MKYLKLYEAFIDFKITPEIRKEIDDILMPLKDIEYAYAFNSETENLLEISIYNSLNSWLQDNNVTRLSDIEDDIYHLIEYLKSFGINFLSVSTSKDILDRLDCTPSISSIDDLPKDMKIYRMDLLFEKEK